MLKLDRRLRRKRESGFTLIEVLIAMLLLLVGVAGVLSLQLISAKATAYSRHATDATVQAEDMMEELAAISTANLVAAVTGTDTITAPGGPYTRTWRIGQIAGDEVEVFRLEVTVEWDERGGATKTIRMMTQRRIQ